MGMKICDTAMAVLEELGLDYNKDGDFMTFSLQCSHAVVHVLLYCIEEKELLLIDVSSRIMIPEDRIDSICHWMAENNYELLLGSFVLNMDKGELSYRVSCPLYGGAVNRQLIGVSISTAIHYLDNYYESIMWAIYGRGQDEFNGMNNRLS